MEKNDLLERLLTEVMDEKLRNDILRYLFKGTTRETNGIMRLNYCPNKPNYNEIYGRMKEVAGGTGVSIARVLGISSQGLNNQLMRGKINGKTLINFSLKTKVSLDWLVGSRTGDSNDFSIDANKSAESTYINTDINTDHPEQQHLLLVETYDQQNGNVELKWCLAKQYICYDDNNHLINGDFSALYSLIMRYRAEAGTPERVKNGGKRHYQVRKVLAYVLGAPKVIRHIDGKAKKYTAEYKSGLIDRPGKTEFRLLSAKEECLQVFSDLVAQNGLTLIKPEFDSIAWDYLIGPGSMSPRDWIVNKFSESLNLHGPGAVTKDEVIFGLHLPTGSIPNDVASASLCHG